MCSMRAAIPVPINRGEMLAVSPVVAEAFNEIYLRIYYTPTTWKDVEKLNAFLDDNKSFF